MISQPPQHPKRLHTPFLILVNSKQRTLMKEFMCCFKTWCQFHWDYIVHSAMLPPSALFMKWLSFEAVLILYTNFNIFCYCMLRILVWINLINPTGDLSYKLHCTIHIFGFKYVVPLCRSLHQQQKGFSWQEVQPHNVNL